MRDLFFNIRAKDMTGAAFDKVRRGLSGIDGAMAGVTERANRMGGNLVAAGGALTALTAPVLLAFRDSLSLFDVQEKAQAKVVQAVRQTGGAAGFAADELFRQASALQAVTRFGDEAILDGVTAQFLTFTNITGDAFTRAQTAALDLSTVLNADLKGTAIMLGKALNDPVRGLGALGEAGITFTQRQKDVVKALAETGRMAEAQAVILDEIQRVYGGQAQAAASVGMGALVQFQNAWGDLKEVVGGHVADLLPQITGFFGSVAAGFTSLPDPMQKAVIAFTAVSAAVGVLTVAIGALMVAAGPVTLTLTLVAGAVAAVTAAAVSLSGETQTLQGRTDDLVASVADEVRATAALSGVLDSGISMSVDTATAKMREAQARYENVKAVIAEHRALVQGSAEYQDAMSALKRGGLNDYGPGPTGHIDPELYRIGAIGRRVDGESQMAMESLSRLGTPPELLKQLSETESQIERLKGLGAEAGSSLGGLGSVTVDLDGVLDGLGGGAGGAAGGLRKVGAAAKESKDELGELLRTIIANANDGANALEGFGKETAEMMSGIFNPGRKEFEDFGDFVDEWGKRLLDRMLTNLWEPFGQTLDGIFSRVSGGVSGGGGGGIGGFLSSVGGSILSALPGFDTGGEMAVSGRAGIDRNIAAFRVSQGETIKVTRRGEAPAPRGSENSPAGGHVSIGFDASTGSLTAVMHDIAGRKIAEARPAIVGDSVGRVRAMSRKSKSFLNR